MISSLAATRNYPLPPPAKHSTSYTTSSPPARGRVPGMSRPNASEKIGSFRGVFLFYCIFCFLLHLCYFSCVLFGGNEKFRIFASKKNGTGFIRFTLFLIYL